MQLKTWAEVEQRLFATEDSLIRVGTRSNLIKKNMSLAPYHEGWIHALEWVRRGDPRDIPARHSKLISFYEGIGVDQTEERKR